MRVVSWGGETVAKIFQRRRRWGRDLMAEVQGAISTGPADLGFTQPFWLCLCAVCACLCPCALPCPWCTPFLLEASCALALLGLALLGQNPAPRTRRQIPKSVKLSPRNCLQKKGRTVSFLIDLVQKKRISSSHTTSAYQLLLSTTGKLLGPS